MMLMDDSRLTQKLRAQISGADRLCLSTISFYEIGQKVRIGRWPEMTPHMDSLEMSADQTGVEMLPVTASVAQLASLMDWAHRDPFDRIICALAKHEGLALMSSDAAFDAVLENRIWDRSRS